MDAHSTTAYLSSDPGKPRKKRVVIIDDVDEILSAAAKELSNLAGEEFDVIPFHYDLSGIYDKWRNGKTKGKLPTWRGKDSQLVKLLEQYEPDFILMDWGYSVKVPGGGELNSPWYSLSTPVAIGLSRNAQGLLFDEARKDGAGIIGQYLLKRPQAQRPPILLYTYNPFEDDVFERLTAVQDKFVELYVGKDADARKAPFQYIETSSFFNHPRALSLYKGWYAQETQDGLKEIGTKAQLEQYGQLLAVLFKDYLDQHTDGHRSSLTRERIFDIEHLRFIRYKRFVSDRLGSLEYTSAAGPKAQIALKLGALTYYDAKGDILLDIPKQDYYDELDAWARDEEIEHLLFAQADEKGGWQRDAKNILYLRLYAKPSGIGSGSDEGKLDLAIAGHHSSIPISKEELKKLTYLIFSSIYYYCPKQGVEWVPSHENVEVLEGVDLRDWRIVKDGGKKPEPIDIFFLCQQVKTEAGRPGWVNYTLYNDTTDIGNLQGKEVESIVDRILFDIRPAIIAKAKDALLPQLFDEVTKQSRSASLSQVLSRTMSHNLGSHSLNALATEQAMSDLLKRLLASDSTKLPGRIDDEAQVTWKPYNEQFKEWLARYNNYLRERMDFLADITTAVPAFETRTHFKDDLLKGFAENHLLTTTIAGSPGFDYRWDPKIYTGKDDILVSIPSDVLGRHALYVILENIVRNSSKHGAHPAGTPVTYTVRVDQVDDPKHGDMLKVTIMDDKDDRWSEESEEYTKLSKTEKDRKLTYQGLARKRNKDIDDPVLDDGRVRRQAWGMLEMKACAAYLRGIDMVDLDEAKYATTSVFDLPLLKAIGEPTGFGFEFYLMRPKDVMVVSANAHQLFQGEDILTLPEFGIATLVLGRLLAQRSVVKHSMLAVNGITRKEVEAFVDHALMDLAALPQEIMLILEGECTDLVLSDLIHERLSRMIEISSSGHAALEHNAKILKRCIVCLARSAWDELARVPKSLYVELRHKWLIQWLVTNRYKDETIESSMRTWDYREKLKADRKALDPRSEGAKVNVDYDAHSRFEDVVKGLLGTTEITVDRILAKYKAGERQIAQRYPKALDRIMKPQVRDDRPDAEILRMSWLQNHFTSWCQGVAVVDERIQRCAEHDHYKTEATPSQPAEENIPVKDLLAMGGVFVLPWSACNLDDPNDFSAYRWRRLLVFLRATAPLLGYVVIHLTTLEKFREPTAKTVEELLDQLRMVIGAARIIVVSGRGKPPGLPKSELFMSFSALSQYTTQTYQRAPVLLNMLCHSARRITD
ncbi:MAG: hypothetical protein IPP83_13545 [Flavobacteriales bacterium]|nr:hypothetical protein [Flavobacteriales bacterium]